MWLTFSFRDNKGICVSPDTRRELMRITDASCVRIIDLRGERGNNYPEGSRFKFLFQFWILMGMGNNYQKGEKYKE